VFAAALLVWLRETGEPLEAARFAACVAASSVEGAGASRVPARRAAERRLRAKREVCPASWLMKDKGRTRAVREPPVFVLRQSHGPLYLAISDRYRSRAAA
jgi:hypothetical protein